MAQISLLVLTSELTQSYLIMLIHTDSSISESELLQLRGEQNHGDKPQALLLISLHHYPLCFSFVNFTCQPQAISSFSDFVWFCRSL